MIKNNIRNFCIIAHIDHGKSTLADRFLELTDTIPEKKMRSQYLDTMDLEREKGITIKMQPVHMFYNLNLISYIFNLIDTPGHVDFSYEVSRALAAVEGAILLVDATKGIQAQTIANLRQAQEQGLDIIPVINKIDLPAARPEEVTKEIEALLKVPREDILLTSAKTGEGVEKILEAIIKKIRPPQGDPNQTRALIFDSIYDEYRGVVAFVRIVDGQITKGNKISFLASGASDEALEVGIFIPKFQPKESLKIGEIGYVVTGLKDINLCRVGDTITVVQTNADKKFNADQRKQTYSSRDSTFSPHQSASSPCESAIQPLAGYKQVKPMVFASVYPTNGEINKLREALGKLKLNDASLFYEPENSRAFGFGFKCGFLGLLHLEIVKERLEREYNLDLIVTTPQVQYQFLSASESKNPHKSAYKEPWAQLDIITPNKYIGVVMQLAQSVRGIYKSTQYLADRVMLKYEAPLASIIVNFYDRLKSVSAGYASLNYDFLEYRGGDLVKMDILIAGEKIDVLSMIVHQSQLMHKAHEIVKKLKELIPQQMFQVTLQAAVGVPSTSSGQGRILAREDISAQKKDVAGYLYGGDITRKKKLWAKQAKGKKKMKKLGRVDIPTDVFIKLLKY